MDPLDTLRAIGALILVLGIIFGLAWALRRYGSKIGVTPGTRTDDLQVVSWKSLDVRRKLAVVRWGDTEHLLCIGPTGDCVVAKRDVVAEPPAASVSPSPIVEDK